MSNNNNKFIDYASVHIKSGHGGRGAISFYSNRQGPCGGKGGKGGDLIIQGDESINNLEYFKHRVHFFAEDGATGGTNNITGKDGSNLIIKVPIGTQIKYLDKQLYIIDSQQHILLKGGRGGQGNGSFKSSCHQTPRFSQPGEAGFSSKMSIELKSLGDFGLIGSPNAGKSTLIRELTNSKSEIGSYAFTTIRPYQGMCGNVCIIDLPGLVPEAHLGKGLGFRFLKHAENCNDLLLVIDVSSKPIYNIEFLLNEVQIYGLKKPDYIIFNKIDLIKKKELLELVDLYKYQFRKIFCISAGLNIGIQTLIDYLQKYKQDLEQKKKNLENSDINDSIIDEALNIDIIEKL